jgi:hypothetical protein
MDETKTITYSDRDAFQMQDLQTVYPQDRAPLILLEFLEI